MKRLLALACASQLMAGCMFVPRRSEDEYAECPVRTMQLTLDAKEMPFGCGDDVKGCLIAIGAVTSVSLVASGSIVLVGNTLHWLETTEKCSMRPAVKVAAREFVSRLRR